MKLIEDPYDRKMIMIPAVPSSGTSALAGVLYHLGVNMGDVHYESRDERRGYEMFEDRNLWKFCGIDYDWRGKIGQLASTPIRLRSYINSRFMNDPPGPIGVKMPGVFCDFDPDPQSLPIITLDIYRLFEQCVASDRARIFSNASKSDRVDGDDEMRKLLTLRACDMGACLAGKMSITTMHEPAVSLTFDELIQDKEEIVPKIAETLNLNSSDEQIRTAIDFLDKDKKHA